MEYKIANTVYTENIINNMTQNLKFYKKIYQKIESQPLTSRAALNNIIKRVVIQSNQHLNHPTIIKRYSKIIQKTFHTLKDTKLYDRITDILQEPNNFQHLDQIISIANGEIIINLLFQETLEQPELLQSFIKPNEYITYESAQQVHLSDYTIYKLYNSKLMELLIPLKTTNYIFEETFDTIRTLTDNDFNIQTGIIKHVIPIRC